ncbi:DMT family transporter [Roseibium salinum]|uniref:DMT family transporter n=1 Tax=Roseibium salinum TaxID=1604349 RepID=A0ABT3QZD2_9HYPH|nr:DMT family transporter [Roseibium sp. DSM 29163]MCX2722313.1 DMT family transporter [Roseibium sp. DSM 29163]
MDKTFRGAAEMTAAMTILGTIGLFVVLSGQAAVDVVFWRCAFGALALVLICGAQGLLRRKISLKKLAIAAVGGVAIVVNWAMLFSAYGEASIGVATAVYNTQPFILVGFGVLFLGERITATKLGWLGIAFAGVLMIVQAKPGSVDYAGSNYALGIALALGAAFFWAVAALLTKKLTGTPPQLIALIQVCVGILMLAPFVSWNALPEGGTAWGALLTLGAVHTGIMYILMYGAVQKLPTYLQGAFSFIYPVVAIFVDYVAFGHRLQPLQLVGAAAIIVAAMGMTFGWRLIRRKVPVGAS